MTPDAQTRRRERLQLGFFALLLALGALQTLRQPVLLDDAYITFRAARNMARGEGLVFNPGERVLSTTAPGYALALAGLARLGVDPVAGGRWLSAGALLAAAFLLLDIFRREGSPQTGFAAGLVLCFFPDLTADWGNECALLLGLFVAAGWLFQRHRPAACAVACAAGTAVRADFALAALLWAALWLRRSRRDFYIYALAGGAMAMAWLGWLIHAFGSALPNTLEVKRLQGHWLATGDPRAFSGWLTLGAGLRWLLRRTLFEPPAGAVALVGLGLLTARPRLWIVPAWAVLHVGAYRLLGVPGHYGWYFYPLWLLISLGAGIGVAAVGAIFRNVPPDAANSAAPAPPGGRWREFATVSALAVFCAMNLYGQADTRWARDKSRAYAGMAQLLRRQVAPGQSVLMNEIGQMGYLSDVRVVDTHGLIHTLRDPDALGRLPQLVDRFRPDYIVLEGWLAGAPPDYGPRVRAGDYELSFILPGGRRARYRESGHVDVPPDHLPVLLKREPDAPPPPAHRPDGAKPPSR